MKSKLLSASILISAVMIALTLLLTLLYLSDTVRTKPIPEGNSPSVNVYNTAPADYMSLSSASDYLGIDYEVFLNLFRKGELAGTYVTYNASKDGYTKDKVYSFSKDKLDEWMKAKCESGVPLN